MRRTSMLRRTPMKRAAPVPHVKPERKVTLPTPRPADAPRASYCSVLPKVQPAPKPITHRSPGWLGAVRSISCVHCGGPSEAAHANIDKGMGIKAPDCATAALCRHEHQRIDQGKDLTRGERRALLDRYIVLTLIELVKAGKVVLA